MCRTKVIFDHFVDAHALIFSVHNPASGAMSIMFWRTNRCFDTLPGENRMEKGFSITCQFFVR
jgi:hypothetical protein